MPAISRKNMVLSDTFFKSGSEVQKFLAKVIIFNAAATSSEIQSKQESSRRLGIILIQVLLSIVRARLIRSLLPTSITKTSDKPKKNDKETTKIFYQLMIDRKS